MIWSVDCPRRADPAEADRTQFKETSGIVEKPDAKALESAKGQVQFDNVRFSYQGKEPAVDGVSFTVPEGTKTALVGESGSGKSTCLKLLFRFYDVAGGSITVDGHDIRDLRLDSLRQNVGVVPQDTVLFNNTIMYNLLYAKPHATEDDVYAACRAANMHDRILAFPDQYNTKVGERGLKLSGGERQRVSRAFGRPAGGESAELTRNTPRLPSRAPSSRTRASSCSTRPRRRWTRTRSGSSRTPWRPSPAAAPPSPSRKSLAVFPTPPNPPHATATGTPGS